MKLKSESRTLFRLWGAAPVAAVLAAFPLALGACDDDEDELPEAESWQAPAPMPGQTGSGGAYGGNPHGGDPHAGVEGAPSLGGNPHAGVEGAPPLGGNPHAGTGGAGNPDLQDYDPPDPNRQINPDKYLRGTIAATAETADRIERGDIMFLSAKPIDPATGREVGAPIAVDRIIVSELPVEFELTEEHMMVAGTQFDGHVVIEARVDSDGEAMTRVPGDVEGSAQAEIPAGGISLELDSIIQ